MGGIIDEVVTDKNNVSNVTFTLYKTISLFSFAQLLNNSDHEVILSHLLTGRLPSLECGLFETISMSSPFNEEWDPVEK